MLEKDMKFEKAVESLESIVSDMENDDIALDVALAKYQEGVALIKFCQDKLKEVEQQIKILDPENETLRDFVINES